MIDVREEIATAPLRAYHYFLAGIVALIVFVDGYDTFNAAYVIHYVAKTWHLTPGESGLLVSSGLVGFMIGALVQGKFSDRVGRRKTLLASLWIATIFSFATATLSHSFSTFCFYRILTGIGLGGLLPVGVTFMNEYAPRRLKSTFSTWGWGLGFSLGGVTASIIGAFVTPKFGWQSLYYVASLSVILVMLCHVVLPESIQFAAMRGDTDDLAKILTRLNPAHAAFYNETGVQFVLPEESDNLASVSLLLSQPYRRTTLALWTAAFFGLFAIFGFTGWIPTAMIARGETFTASFGFGALIMLMNFFGTLACGYVADRLRKDRVSLAIWWTIGGLAIGALAFVNHHYLNFICVAAGGFFILGGQGALNNITAAWHETEVRATAVGMMLGVGRLGGILGPFLTGAIQQTALGRTGLFVAIAIAVLLGAAIIAFARPASSLDLRVTAIHPALSP